MKKRPEVQNAGFLKKLVDNRFTLPTNAYALLIQGLNTTMTPQGNPYWTQRYYWLAEQVMAGTNYGDMGEPMIEGDWQYLERLINPPVDKFLIAEENKEFIC